MKGGDDYWICDSVSYRTTYPKKKPLTKIAKGLISFGILWLPEQGSNLRPAD